MNAVMKDIKDKFIKKFNVHIEESNDKLLSVYCRNWGHWDFPLDESNDNGEEEDCNYLELSDDSLDELKLFMTNIKSEYPNYSFKCSFNEKNYIDFKVTLK